VAWFTKQPNITKAYVYVACQLNDIGILPGGSEIKPWVRQEMTDSGYEASKSEISTILTGLIAEHAISQDDVNRLLKNAKVQRVH
jgi:hypothetical protein